MTYRQICTFVAAIAVATSGLSLTACSGKKDDGKPAVSKEEKAQMEQQLAESKKAAEEAIKLAEEAKANAERAFAERDSAVKEKHLAVELKNAAEIDKGIANDERSQALEQMRAAEQEKIAALEDVAKREEQIKKAQAELQLKVEAAIQQQSAAESARNAAVEEQKQAEAMLKQRKADLVAAEQALNSAKTEAAKTKENATKILEDSEAQAATTKEQSQAEAAKTKKESNALLENAQKTKAEAEQALADAEANNVGAQERLAKANQLLEDAHYRQAQLDVAIDLWRNAFSEVKLDNIFDKIMNEEDVNFYISVIGLADAKRVKEMRQEMMDLNTNKTYRSLNKFNPDVRNLEILIRNDVEKARVAADKDMNAIEKLPINLAFGSPVTLNDNYVIRARAADVKKMRDQINSSESKDNLLMIVRLVEGVRIGVGLDIMAREKINEEAKMMKSIKLGTKDTSNLVEISELDITRPGRYIFGSAQAGVCEKVSADCLKAMKDVGLLDQTVDIAGIKGIDKREFPIPSVAGLGAQYMTAQKFLFELFMNSKDQIGRDLTYVNSVHTRSNILNDLFGPTQYVINENLEEEEVGSQSSVQEIQTPVVERVRLFYTVSLIEKISVNGLIYADTVLNKGFGGISVEEIGKGEFEIDLPISSLKASVMDYKKSGYVKAEAEGAKSKKDAFIKSATEQIGLFREAITVLQ